MQRPSWAKQGSRPGLFPCPAGRSSRSRVKTTGLQSSRIIFPSWRWKLARRWAGGNTRAGLERFGASSPGKVALENLGFGVDSIVKRSKALVERVRKSEGALAEK